MSAAREQGTEEAPKATIAYETPAMPTKMGRGDQVAYGCFAVITWFAAVLVSAVVLLVLLKGSIKWGSIWDQFGGLLVIGLITAVLYWAAIHFTRRAAGR